MRIDAEARFRGTISKSTELAKELGMLSTATRRLKVQGCAGVCVRYRYHHDQNIYVVLTQVCVRRVSKEVLYFRGSGKASARGTSIHRWKFTLRSVQILLGADRGHWSNKEKYVHTARLARHLTL